MASAFFLYGQFEEVLVYLNSIRSYFVNDDTFNYNYAQVKSVEPLHIVKTLNAWFVGSQKFFVKLDFSFKITKCPRS